MQSQRGGGALWVLQALTGLGLIVLLGLHMIAQHFLVEGGLRTYQDVLAYIANPVVFILEVIFLLVVVPHAFLGLRAVLLDLGPSSRTSRIMDGVLVVIATITTIYGVVLFVVLQGRI
jgi:succinate dehydrogenase hydrophobic anchor subunit